MVITFIYAIPQSEQEEKWLATGEHTAVSSRSFDLDMTTVSRNARESLLPYLQQSVRTHGSVDAHVLTNLSHNKHMTFSMCASRYGKMWTSDLLAPETFGEKDRVLYRWMEWMQEQQPKEGLE